ncbi:TetR/AcrR family transcriptional regulator [Ruthenibacterium lactatiformans]|uniref:TetR/AcrR family transcriptional regulator n=1 Tax=Ruthenibacterium lactatiformans TaxID=1550024 RepID=UPI0019673BDA|nr:TetR/AcrR family transcriptional regulator [Ruthenibacterium lactatiformans]MBN3020244.1 TetR/AcrR family transcriptional regulator [Ruthenibacterium lactatiformans]
MPPKAKITREMIIDATFEIIRNTGVEAVNARTISKKLNCSTQPVMYHFKTIDELKRAVYEKSDEYHSAYIMDIHSNNPMKDIGLNYIQFAVKEKDLFRFLFQSNEFLCKNISELINAEELQPIIAILSQETAVNAEQAKIIFRSLFLIAHGYASMFANNEMEYDEQTVLSDLGLIFDGAVKALRGGF